MQNQIRSTNLIPTMDNLSTHPGPKTRFKKNTESIPTFKINPSAIKKSRIEKSRARGNQKESPQLLSEAIEDPAQLDPSVLSRIDKIMINDKTKTARSHFLAKFLDEPHNSNKFVELKQGHNSQKLLAIALMEFSATNKTYTLNCPAVIALMEFSATNKKYTLNYPAISSALKRWKRYLKVTKNDLIHKIFEWIVDLDDAIIMTDDSTYLVQKNIFERLNLPTSVQCKLSGKIPSAPPIYLKSTTPVSFYDRNVSNTPSNSDERHLNNSQANLDERKLSASPVNSDKSSLNNAKTIFPDKSSLNLDESASNFDKDNTFDDRHKDDNF